MGYSDASMANGEDFVLGERRSRMLLLDDPPPREGRSITGKRIQGRKPWRHGMRGTQIGWSLHGRVRILRMENGIELAAWLDETHPPPVE